MVEDGDTRSRPSGKWTERVAFSDDSPEGPFAYAPGVVLTTNPSEALKAAGGLPDNQSARARRTLGLFTELVDVADPIALVRELRLLGIVAQPDHVFFAHCGPCCPPHPATACAPGAAASPVYATPVYATPVYATPVYATPVYATPVYATPVYATPASPVRRTGVRRSSARPIPADADTSLASEAAGHAAADGAPLVIVLDTGLAGTMPPPALERLSVTKATALDVDAPDEDGNDLLDPASGHGTFIAGIVKQVAPGSRVVLHRVLSTMGDGHESNIVECLTSMPIPDPQRTVVNLSFGGPVLEQAFAMEWAIRKLQARGVVVVASAGNDGSCRPAYPAAFPGVVSVGAVGPNGPAPFSNYGPWVRACAPGVNLMSTFFKGYDGNEPPGPTGVNPDAFDGWALWSGTSFAGPVVAGALARTILLENCTAAEAVKRVIDEPALMRIPNLGTVINVL